MEHNKKSLEEINEKLMKSTLDLFEKGQRKKYIKKSTGLLDLADKNLFKVTFSQWNKAKNVPIRRDIRKLRKEKAIRKKLGIQNYNEYKDEVNLFIDQVLTNHGKYHSNIYDIENPIAKSTGRIRRNSVIIENDKTIQMNDEQDIRRDLVMDDINTLPKNKTVKSIIRIGVLSVHGNDNYEMCDGHHELMNDSLLNAPLHEKKLSAIKLDYLPGCHLKSWMSQSFSGRATPDVIVLLEGKPDKSMEKVDILNERYHIIRNKKEETALSTQNITAWNRNPNLIVNILDLTFDKFIIPCVVVSYKNNGKLYSEVICHLENTHAHDRRWTDLEVWRKSVITNLNIELKSKGLGTLVNVMGDTNFSFDYIPNFSPSLSIGGPSDDYSLPSSSTIESKFMRQIFSKLIKSDDNIRLHRGSYLNIIQVRKGKGMLNNTSWGTDHPSFMSYTSLWE